MYTILSVNTFSIQQNLTWSDYPLKGLLFLNNKGTILAIFSCVQEKLCTIERFHSRGRQLCIFIGTKESDKGLVWNGNMAAVSFFGGTPLWLQ